MVVSGRCYCNEPSKVVSVVPLVPLRTLISELWWWIRGVRANDYRALCRHCGRTGQVHYSLLGCRRFKAL